MRLGVVYEPNLCPYYRAIDPMKAMEQRGHDVLWPDEMGRADWTELIACDVVHLYRAASDSVQRAFKELVAAGPAVIYDNDDNFAAIPKGAPGYEIGGGLAGERAHAWSVRMATLATTFTTTTETLAQKYRNSGVKRVEVIPNCVTADVPRSRSRHDGVVIGWIAGMQHQVDADQLGIGDVLQRVMDKHEDVRVECVGVDLRLSERYAHHPWLPFAELFTRMGAFDIGIAPIENNPLNRARSDIKVKEYAASGVPWLASPVGPYTVLGEDQGGWLVPDGQWFEAFDRLLNHPRERRQLARKAKKWAKRQGIDAMAGEWERVFVEAANASSRRDQHAARVRT
jgi:glycosyltransferase involved in cell wall biosynthesis